VDTDTFAHPFNIAAYLTRLGTTTGVYIGLDCPQQHCFQSPGFSFMQGESISERLRAAQDLARCLACA
jgi:hypothetical protein